MPLPPNTLKKLLIESSLIAEDEFPALEAEAKRVGVSIDRFLISQGRLTTNYLNQLVSKFLNIPVIDFRVEPLNIDIVELLPESVARQREVIVFGKDPQKNVFKIAMTDPTNLDTTNFLAEYLKGNIQPYIASPETLRFAYQIYKKKASEQFEQLISSRVTELIGSLKEVSGAAILESVPLVQLFDTILDYGSTLNASDIYFQPQEESLAVRFRIDGLLKDVISIDRKLNDGLVARTKILSGLRIDEHLKPQDGRFKFRSSDTEIDIRTAIMPTFYGEKVTLRLLAGAKEFVSFEELGIGKETADKLRKEITKPYGMILSSGPTGSGKTTTIYAILTLLNRPEVHITTIEDPIEYLIPRVSQTQINPTAGITFASGLRALLRHSPDIMVVGEIRDNETAEIAAHAALTGHLLISSIHTNDAPTAIPRLIELGVPPFFISGTVNAVIAQRLLRRICRQCINSQELLPAARETINQELAKRGKKREMAKIAYRGKGCRVCGMTGYSGRIGIFEVFVIDENVRSIINSGAVTSDNLKKAADDQRMTTMFEDGLSKIEQGDTTVEELFRAIRE
ncbi:MAG: hypothetical protein A3J67_03340 [Parcubacteria group bacterium RIFCSPHIGHO2_02_FULL_48_10b]|nr:MAG: hypothetical protein A3J67_03340 [Parcubacteria group bacterium RIFCSPHIGHO2_02_FULL_48_10b]